MNNKFGRDDRQRADLEQSPDRQFETSGNYREPREPYGETYTSPERRYGSAADGGWSEDRAPSRSRSRYDGAYAPSYGGYPPETRGGFAGRGPKGYVRSDERIREDVCDRLSWNDEIDATEISVRVENGEVTLEGSVETRHMKRLAADVAEDVVGVLDVHNTVRVQKPILTEIREKLTGEALHEHYANTGTKSTRASSPASARNGMP
ncbi:MAG TPA: BON domain-containing protein [Polyangiaceae bacterium]|nr:BON domain-containing protein [Polyangiaceae bacterium]